ncbi:hypothetical protein GGTG_07625 [Gaeumannomyces tritici R3-111a-1]|uniref:DUF7703 domain-containing protein n=1 Tax=Gaeumannomyces tritici (strain R3-111a-1) TaxID=644352 RepID=J3P277_GAET3|nr:hypothetical protein GGTG_07625 [Gaeumannomyces tritici R3-111a-1]EJT73769.1 hypothetical protein GGTG_07625 [Gaeumannomyces tritici R3-111a-1]
MGEPAPVAAGLASHTTHPRFAADTMVGEDGPIANKVSLAEAMVMAGFLSVPLWNTLQTAIFIFQFFKRFPGLYFWSISAANFGIPLRQVTALLRFLGLAPKAMLPLSSVGFWAGGAAQGAWGKLRGGGGRAGGHFRGGELRDQPEEGFIDDINICLKEIWLTCTQGLCMLGACDNYQ